MLSFGHEKFAVDSDFNSGGCNGCDIEILSLLTPRYDVERFGILKESSPRHADILIAPVR
jgi:Ni,Fe-hydrogenase III small subunit